MIYLFLVPVLLGRGLALATLGCIQQPATSSEGAFGIMPPVLPVVISMKLFRKKSLTQRREVDSPQAKTEGVKGVNLFVSIVSRYEMET